MLDWHHIIIQQERYQDLLLEAQSNRLVKEARQAYTTRRPFCCQALAWLGRQLVIWGVNLQTRFSSVTSDPTLEPAHSH